MKHRLSVQCISLLLGLSLSACNLPFLSGSGSGSRNPERVKMPVDETAAALEDPERAEQGVWSLLATLGIGVYTGDGTPVMPGSETREQDFWLYDFEVGSLARMAGQAAESFGSFYAVLDDLGYPGSETELLALYRDTYAEHADHIFVQLLDEMGVDFSSGQMLTPLQSWLLLLDTFVPPNGSAGATGTSSETGGHMMLQAAPQQGVPCGQITGIGVMAYWGLFKHEADSAGYFAAVETYYAIHGPMLASAVQATLESSMSEVHEGHNEKGDRVEFTVDVQVNYVPWQSVPVGAISCGVLVNMDWRPLVGGFENVPVEWDDPAVLARHATLERMDRFTDLDGKAQFIVQMQEEEAAGIGPYKDESATLSAALDLRLAFMQEGIADDRLLSFIPPVMELFPEDILVSWHDPCDEFTIWFIEELHQSVASFSNDLLIEGPISVQIYPGRDPATLDGSGTLPVSGQGKADDCQFTNSGVDQVNVSGTVTPGEGDEPPMLKMTINHSLQISLQGSECGGGSQMPVPLGEFTLEMPMRDGEMQGGPFSQPTVTGLTTYTLEVACWE